MLVRTTVTKTEEIELTVEDAAKWFWGLSDEDQAQFLIEVQKVSYADCGAASGTQWAYAMGHLRDCACSNMETRQMVRDWASHLGEDMT